MGTITSYVADGVGPLLPSHYGSERVRGMNGPAQLYHGEEIRHVRAD